MSSTSQTNFKKTRLIHSADNVDVYEGSHAKFGRKVVIKELKGEANDAVRAEFFREAEQWAQFEHHRLGRIDEINHDRGWIVQEFLAHSFTDRYQGAVNLSDLKNAMLQLLEGLDVLHQQGFLHCNVTSSNFRFNDPGEGAKLCDGRGVAISQASQLPRPKGSNKYRAPEMLDNRFGPIGMATDIYLAGTVILEGLAGDRFDSFFQGYVLGTPDPETGWFRWHNSDDELESVKSLVDGLPEAFAKLLDDMLSKNVGRRVGSARDAIEELNRIDMESTVLAHQAPPAPDQREPSPPAPAAPKPPGESGTESNQELHLISRPSTPAYMRIASGSQAGKIIPLPMQDILIGESAACQVQLSATEYPRIAGREVTVALGSGGWKVSETKRPEDCNDVLYVGRQVCQPSLPVKSGDIIRLSDTGPDIQFVIQGEASWSWQDVADEFKMKIANRERSGRDSKSREQKTAPLGSAAPPPKPSPPISPSPPVAAATPPQVKPQTGPAPPAPAKQKKPKKQAQAAQPKPKPSPAQPKAPPQAAPPAPVAAAPSSSAAPAPPAVDKKGKLKQKAKGSSGNPLQDKNKRNWIILIGGLVFAAILVILFVPQSGDQEEKKDKDSSAETQNDESADNKKSDEGEKSDESSKGSSNESKGDQDDSEKDKNSDSDQQAAWKYPLDQMVSLKFEFERSNREQRS